VICKFIASRTAELQQQCIERWYAVGYGKFRLWKCSVISIAIFSQQLISQFSEHEEIEKKKFQIQTSFSRNTPWPTKME